MTHASFADFKELHYTSSPLMLANVWDAPSAALVAAEGAKAVGTSSASMAWSLGYPDGGALPRVELLAAVRRILRVIAVPLTVDIEDGYSDDPTEVADLVVALYHAGACGINLEDGAGSPDLLVRKIAAIRKALNGSMIFINARTDVYLRGMASGDTAVNLTIDRLRAYQEAGADGAFVPGLWDVAATERIVKAVRLPLNLMTLPGPATIDALAAAGVRRFTLGPALFQAAYGLSRKLARAFSHEQATAGVFDHGLAYDFMNKTLAESANGA
jgi:2-methylisocitrate lyase-like PEP mutase family enzyme